MKQNVGTLERIIRAIIGIAIIAAGVYYQSWWGAIGAIPLLTAIIGWCPPYALLGLSTAKNKAEA
jgi:phosphate/sulfate permease